MPRRRLQFSLFTLFLLITLCAAGLGVWYNQPPSLRSSSTGRGWTLENTVNGFPYSQGQFSIHSFWYESPRGWEHVYYAIVILPPSDTLNEFNGSSAGSGGSHDYVEIQYRVSDFNEQPLGNVNGRVDADLRKRIISARGQELPLQTGGVYVLQLGLGGHQTFTHDDGTFEDLNITEETREKLREYHQRYLEEMEAATFPKR